MQTKEYPKLTNRQVEVLACLSRKLCMRSEGDGSVLRALERKGLVTRHHNSAPGHIYYTWTRTLAGTDALWTISMRRVSQ